MKRGVRPKAWYESDKMKLGFGVAGIVLVALVLIALANVGPGSGSTVAPADDVTGGTGGSGDAQVVTMSIDGIDYNPAVITVQAGRPVTWIIDDSRASGCMHYIRSPQLGINQRLNGGTNTIKFTPTQRGSYKFTCAMGMGDGTIVVI